MKILFRLLLLALLLGGCVKNEVTLTFRLPADFNEPCRLMYYASAENVGMMREAVAEIVGGKGEIKLPERYPSLIFLFSPAQKMPAVVMYAARGDKLGISGDTRNMGEWRVEGTDINKLISDWRVKNYQAISSGNASGINKAVEEFVGSHPSSPASAIILYCYFQRRGHEKEFEKLLDRIDHSVTEDYELMEALSIADMVTEQSLRPEYPDEIVMMGEDGYADTLALKSGKPVLMMFRGSTKSGMKDFPMDSVKKYVEKQGKAVIAEFYIDSDSLNWRRQLRQDTVPSLRRMWMPLGLSDSLAIKLVVRRSPYFIVVDAKGKEVYRGDSWSAAAEKLDKTTR